MTGSKNKHLVMIGALCLLSACQNIPFTQTNKSVNDSDFSLETVAKTDINMVLDIHVKVLEQHLYSLMLKLYLRNPGYWRNSGFENAEARVKHVLALPDYRVSKMVENTRSIESLQLAFEPAYTGDRVLAFVFGLKTMLRDAYGGRREFFVLDQLDPQKLYDSARNIEVAVWKLSNDRLPGGQLYLISNELQGRLKNLSFERLFGKMIAVQDNSARVVADSTNRVIKNVIQGVARFVFLPI